MARKTIETNPFAQGLEIRGLWKSEWIHKQSPDGEGVTTGQIQVALLDAETQFTVYSQNFIEHFRGLSSSAKDMVMWLGSHLQHNQDYLELREKKYCLEMDVSRNTFFSAKALLMNRFIIPRSDRKDTYWINPAYLFRGSRVKMFRDQVVPVNENPIEKFRKTNNNGNIHGYTQERERGNADTLYQGKSMDNQQQSGSYQAG